MEDRISAEEAELYETGEEMKELMMERWSTKSEEWRVSDNVGVDVGCEVLSGARSYESEVRYLGELGLGVFHRVSLGGGRETQNTSRVGRTIWRWTWTRTRRS